MTTHPEPARRIIFTTAGSAGLVGFPLPKFAAQQYTQAYTLAEGPRQPTLGILFDWTTREDTHVPVT